jgi:hypothetical protein
MATNAPAMNRRALLRGAGGVALSLPLLEAMLPRRAAAATAPRRFLVWVSANGTVTDRWVCPVGASPSEFTLSEILAPLERHKADMVGVQNLRKFSGYAHEFPTCLTGRKYKDLGYPKIYATGSSLDQYMASKWQGLTPIPSLQLGVGVNGRDRDVSSSVSWRAADQSLPPENNPFALYARLFTDGTPAATTGVKRTFSARRSVLDSVLGETTTLSQRLGRADKAVVDNYLESVRGVEKQMTALEAKTTQCTPPKVGPDPTPAGATQPWWLQQANTAGVIKAHADLCAAAFACDLTRVIVLQVCGSGGSGRVHSWLPDLPKGVDWHGISHQVEKGMADGLAAIDRWYSGQLAVLLDSLKAMPEAGGTVLSNSLVMTMNEYGPNGAVQLLPAAADGSRDNLTHQTRLMPILLFGQLGGALRTGRWMVYPFASASDAKAGLGRHLNPLFVSLLNAYGIPDQTFGDPMAQQGPLPGLFT